ncbi:interferon-related developmental regulator 2-like isoform X1 [Polyodon spathula]|uniref:interferon-related developmental regulator 2-like isoform X1 n=2 Tax=Polyodon spathula TaxID=7913 RepID=UPI001B7DFBB7|nr:interferon-related developmental regulator 2-like isoform X1 [Polyodon spathula]
MQRSKKGRRGGNNQGSQRQELLQFHLSAKAPQSGKGGWNGAKAESAASDDDVASEVLSHCSSASDTTSVNEEGTGTEPGDEQTAAVEMEDKLKQCIDNLMDKSVKSRLNGLESLKLAFSSKTLCDFLVERRLTLTDCLERCLRKGGVEEQAAAAQVSALLCIQLGGVSEGEEIFKVLQPILSTILSDPGANPAARQSCASALGMCCYVAAADNVEDLCKSLSHLESIFTESYPKRDGTLPTHKPGIQALHCTALQSWSLLITICPASRVDKLLEEHLPRLQACLSSNDVHFRIAVGETIALLIELARESDREFVYEDTEDLCEQLKGLATDSNKYRAKTDRRKQRSVFREVLHSIESEDFTEERIRFSVESIYIDCWVRRRIYDAFKEVLGSGVLHHLQLNQLLRDIFELGPPLMLDRVSIRASKVSRFEKHLYNSAAFKARTKIRNKVRDKRADVL